jgi:hypothetical protein
MKKSNISRRKFIAGLGVAAGAAAALGTLKSTSISGGGRLAGATAVTKKRPAVLAQFPRLIPLQKVNRPAGTSRLPLMIRPT